MSTLPTLRTFPLGLYSHFLDCVGNDGLRLQHNDSGETLTKKVRYGSFISNRCIYGSIGTGATWALLLRQLIDCRPNKRQVRGGRIRGVYLLWVTLLTVFLARTNQSTSYNIQIISSRGGRISSTGWCHFQPEITSVTPTKGRLNSAVKIVMLLWNTWRLSCLAN